MGFSTREAWPMDTKQVFRGHAFLFGHGHLGKECPVARKNAVLRVRLAECDMTFAELARRAKLHPVTLSRVYHQTQKLSEATAMRVARVLRSDPEALGLVKRAKGGRDGR